LWRFFLRQFQLRACLNFVILTEKDSFLARQAAAAEGVFFRCSRQLHLKNTTAQRSMVKKDAFADRIIIFKYALIYFQPLHGF
jgi:hypothetical protein